jgi:uncharacterized membrane protein YeaQ/YmgE (transglycosylase-associated protein family)
MLILLLVAGVCGSVGQAIAGYSRGGCLVSIALGFIGALLGMWLAGVLGLHELFHINIGASRFRLFGRSWVPLFLWPYSASSGVAAPHDPPARGPLLARLLRRLLLKQVKESLPWIRFLGSTVFADCPRYGAGKSLAFLGRR